MKAHLTDEVRSLHQKIAELEACVTVNKQAKGKLKESEEGYRKLIEISPNAIFVHIDQKIAFMNPAGLEIIGAHNSSEIIGKSILDLTHPDYLEVIKRRQELLKKGEASRNEYFKAIRLDGSVIDVETTSARMTYQGESAIISTIRDVTDKLKAEASLREREAELFTILNNVPSILIVVDQDRRVQRLNRAAAEFGKRSPEEMTGLRGGQALRCLHSLDDPKGCGYGPSCEACAVRNTVLETFKTGKSFYQREAQLPFDIDGKTEELALLVSTTTVEISGDTMVLVCLEDMTERKQAEKAVVKSVQLWQSTFDGITDGVCLLDSDAKILLSNQSMSRMFEKTHDQIIGRSCCEILHASPEHPKDCPLVRMRSSLKHEELELSIGDKWFHIIVDPITDADGKLTGAVHIISDITEQKKSDDALRESEQLYRSLVSILTSFVWITDAEGKFVEPQLMWKEFTGQTWAEHKGWGWAQAIHPDDRARVEKSWIDAVQNRATYHSNGRMMRANGKYCHYEAIAVPILDDHGRFLEWVGTVTDVTEQIQADEEIEKLAKFPSENPYPVLRIAKDGEVLYSNKAGEQLLSKWNSEVGKTVPEKWCNLIAKAFASEKDKEEEEEEVENKVFSVIIAPVKDAGYANFYGMDITDRKKAELKVQRYRVNLEKTVDRRTKELTSVNKELEAFAHSVSHDLRAPLRSINGFSHALLEDYEKELGDEGKDFIKRICTASEQMGDLIEGILRLSQLTRKEMACEKVDLAELASGIISNLRKVHPDRDVTFTAPDSTLVEGDPVLITALMQNLIENAWKFSSPRDHAHIEFAAKEQDGETIYSLGDDGVGFDMAYAGNLFEPFQRLHSNDEFPGTGIGLATAQRVINRHNGRIWAESEVGKGSVFYFTL